MFGRFAIILASLGFVSASPVYAQSGDFSPSILIESGPSDNPDYRRMVFVRYLSGDRVTASYVAYNRSEFRQVPNNADVSVVRECASGPGISLRAIQDFEKAERRRANRNETPEIARFCIKGVSGWEAGNKDRYTDPIFNGMPFAATRR